MKKPIKHSYNPGGNLRASSSNVDNFRNNQNGISIPKNIPNNLVSDNYYFRNNNYINIKFDKFNNINSTTNKRSENKKYNYNMIQPQSQSRSKHNMNFGRYLNDINDMDEDLREFSKSIEKGDNIVKKLEQVKPYLNISSNKNMNMNVNLASSKKNKEMINSYINININRNEDFAQGENSFRFSSVNNNNITNNNVDVNNTSNTYETNNIINNGNNNYYNMGENKFNYKEFKKSNTNQYKQKKNNNYNYKNK
jgi:hypothetical protein